MLNHGLVARLTEGMVLRSIEGAAHRALKSSIQDLANANTRQLAVKGERDQIATVLSQAGVDYNTIKIFFDRPKDLEKEQKEKVAQALIPELGYDRTRRILG